jgi:hypothetical protein
VFNRITPKLTNRCPYEKQILVKRRVQFFSALFFITCFTAQADVSVFGNSPSGGSGGLSSGYINPTESYWCAIGFTPQENIDLSSVSIWLSAFNGQNVGVSIALNGDNPEFNAGGTATNFPEYGYLDFSSPAPNDGSLAAFTFTNPTTGNPLVNPSGSTVLLADTEYWLVVVDTGNPGVGTAVSWVAGETPAGEAMYDGSATDSGEQLAWNTASGLPAFSINTVPEPGSAALVVIPLLLGAGHRLFKARKSLL